jgi:Fe-S cluster assembly iron-binding protein IscA
VDESAGIKIVYEKNVGLHLAGKVIDYRTGNGEGFTITAESGGNSCGGCSC